MGRLDVIAVAVWVSVVAVMVLALLPGMGSRILHVMMPHASIAILVLALMTMMLLCSWSSAEIVPPGTEVVISSADDTASSHYIYDSTVSGSYPQGRAGTDAESILLPIEFSDFPPLVPSRAPEDFIRFLSIRERMRSVARMIDFMDSTELPPEIEDILLPIEFSDSPPLVPRSKADAYEKEASQAGAILREEGPAQGTEVVTEPVSDSSEPRITDAYAISGTDANSIESGVPRDMTAREHFDDFWATFFIQGEDELLLEDGDYYMELLINGNEVGDVTVYMKNDVAYLVASEIRSYVSDTITDEADLRIFAHGSNLMSIEEFNAAGVETSFDSTAYTVSMWFSTDDMPVQVLSVRNTTGSVFSNRPPIAGAIELEPAVFALSTRYSLLGSFLLNPISRFADSLNMTLSLYNTARLYDVFADFSFSFRFGLDDLDFSLGSYKIYHDFEDEMIRLTVGNVSTDLLSPEGTDIGISFEKNLSYGPLNARRQSHIEQLLTIEKESEVQIINEGKEIYKRILQPGNYRIQDFVLYTGANRIRIIVTPLDGSPSFETDIELSYSSSLLAPGEVFFGGAIATGRRMVSSSSSKMDGSIRLPIWNGRSFEYDWRRLVLSGNVRVGLTRSLTLDASLALRNEPERNRGFNPSGRLALEFTHANVLGVTRYNLNIMEETDSKGAFMLPGIYARIGHQVNTGFAPVSSLNLGLTYETYSGDMMEDHRFSLSASVSGGVDLMSWGLSLSGALNTDSIADFSWNASASMSFSFTRNYYMSASASIGGIGEEMQYLNGRLSATIRFSPARVNITASNYETSAEFSISKNRHSFSTELATDDFAHLNAYSLDADYSYYGNYVNVGAGLYATNVFDSIRGSFSLSTASVFADGYMAFSSNVPSNYLFIAQKGALKGNELTLGVAGTSSAAKIPTFFDVGFYRGVSSVRGTSLSIFSTADNAFSGMSSYDVYIPASKIRGYVVRIEADEVYAVSGVVYLPDGTIWTNGASPVYSMKEEGCDAALTMTDLYLFSDSDGRFVLSDLEPGTYAFDVQYGDKWLLYSFDVAAAEDHVSDIQMLGAIAENADLTVSAPYADAYEYSGEVSYMNGTDFWNMLYPPMEVAV